MRECEFVADVTIGTQETGEHIDDRHACHARSRRHSTKLL